MPRCVTCGAVKNEDEFNWRYKALGVRHPTCRDCHKAYRKNWYEGSAHERHLQNVKERKSEARSVAREYVWNYLSAHPCMECGESDPVVLEFDHIAGKRGNVSRMVADGVSVERIKEEINRCQVLCSNCHRRKTSKERGWFRK